MRTIEELELELTIAKQKEEFWLKMVRDADKEMTKGEYPYHLYSSHSHFESVVRTLNFVLGKDDFI